METEIEEMIRRAKLYQKRENKVSFFPSGKKRGRPFKEKMQKGEAGEERGEKKDSAHDNCNYYALRPVSQYRHWKGRHMWEKWNREKGVETIMKTESEEE